MMALFDARLRATLASVAACAAVLTLASLPLLGAATTISVATGGALAATNLWVLARIVTALLPGAPPGEGGGDNPGPEPRRAGAWTLLALTKMGALFALVWLLVRYSLVSPIPMLAGFASLPLGIAIGSLVSDRSLRGEH
jgi:uncharacterized membrane protein